MMNQSLKLFLDRRKVILLGFVIFAAYYCIFIQFFPNKIGALGHDYYEIMPKLISNHIWYMNNGILNIPFFSPYITGGNFSFTHAQDISLSLGQYFLFFANPLKSMILSFFVFALIGFVGFYFLLRKAFKYDIWVSLTGASLFLFNGFYAYHVIIGHFNQHNFMLLSPILLFLLWDVKCETNRKKKLTHWFFCCMIGLLFAYSIHVATMYKHIIFGLTILGILSFFSFFSKKAYPWYRLAFGLFIAILVSAAKLAALFSLTRNIERLEILNGLVHSGDFFLAFFSILFYSGKSASPFVHWEHHEAECGITPLPLLFIVVGIIYLYRKGRYKELLLKMKSISSSGFFLLFLGFFLFYLPYTFVSPGFREFYSEVPLMKYLRTAPRFFSIYIIPLILLSMYTFNKIFSPKMREKIGLLSILFIIIFAGAKDDAYYHTQSFNPGPGNQYYDKLVNNKIKPKIHSISKKGNEALLTGGSSDYATSYEALLTGESSDDATSYETLKHGMVIKYPLIEGSIFLENNGHLNMRNPACDIYPEANDCEPGDHFRIDQKEDLKNFAAYKPYNFKLPLYQKAANYLSIFFFAVCVAYLIGFLICYRFIIRI